MKRILSVFIGALLVIVLAACNKERPDEEETSIDMTPSFTQEELEKEVDFEAAEENGEIAKAESGEVIITNGEGDNGATDVQESAAPMSSFRSTATKKLRSRVSPIRRKSRPFSRRIRRPASIFSGARIMSTIFPRRMMKWISSTAFSMT